MAVFARHGNVSEYGNTYGNTYSKNNTRRALKVDKQVKLADAVKVCPHSKRSLER